MIEDLLLSQQVVDQIISVREVQAANRTMYAKEDSTYHIHLGPYKFHNAKEDQTRFWYFSLVRGTTRIEQQLIYDFIYMSLYYGEWEDEFTSGELTFAVLAKGFPGLYCEEYIAIPKAEWDSFDYAEDEDDEDEEDDEE